MSSQHDHGSRLSDAMWARMATLIPPPKPHSLGCHRPRIPDRVAMDASLLLLRTDMQWAALDATGLCSHSAAHRRFREWTDAGVPERFWQEGLLACGALEKIDWGWLALDDTMTKAPLGGEKIDPNPTDRGKGGVKRSLLNDGHGLPLALVIDGAPRHDSMLLEQTLAQIVIDKPVTAPCSWLCLERGYVGRRVYEHVWQIGMVPWLRGRRHERMAKREGARARRWVVERSHSWFHRYCRLLICWERHAVSTSRCCTLAVA